jgi:hypothetical protein
MIATDKPHAILSSRTIHKRQCPPLHQKTPKNDYWYCQSKTNNYQYFGVKEPLFFF